MSCPEVKTLKTLYPFQGLTSLNLLCSKTKVTCIFLRIAHMQVTEVKSTPILAMKTRPLLELHQALLGQSQYILCMKARLNKGEFWH